MINRELPALGTPVRVTYVWGQHGQAVNNVEGVLRAVDTALVIEGHHRTMRIHRSRVRKVRAL